MLFEKLPWPRSGMPRRSRIGLWAPSAATRYCARIVSSSPLVAVPDRRGHAVAVLLDGDGLVRVADVGAELLGPPAQDRLEADLRDEQARGRAQLLDALVDGAEEPLDLLAAEALDGHDRAVLLELEGRGA